MHMCVPFELTRTLDSPLPNAIPTGVVMKPSALRAHLVHLHNAVRDVASALRKSGYWSALDESDSPGRVGSRVRNRSACSTGSLVLRLSGTGLCRAANAADASCGYLRSLASGGE